MGSLGLLRQRCPSVPRVPSRVGLCSRGSVCVPVIPVQWNVSTGKIAVCVLCVVFCVLSQVYWMVCG